jgi:predicted RNA-binding protein Jag
MKRKLVKVKVTHPGILGGKGATKKPLKYFIAKAKRNYKGTITALTNLQRWNKRRKPSLAKWAKTTKEKIHKALRTNKKRKKR